MGIETPIWFEGLKYALLFILFLFVVYPVVRVVFKAFFLSYFEAKNKFVKKNKTDEEVK